MIFHWLTELAARTVLMSPLGVPFRTAQRFFGLLPGQAAFGELFPEDHYREQEPVLRKDSQAKVF